jgi:hypothetical protein
MFSAFADLVNSDRGKRTIGKAFLYILLFAVIFALIMWLALRVFS